MGKLHQVLAVRQGKRQEANEAFKELMSVFKDQSQVFFGMKETFTPDKEEEGDVVIEKQKGIHLSVFRAIVPVTFSLASALDAECSVDYTNAQGSSANADIILDDGKKILENVPIMALMNMEKEISNFLNLIAAIPIMDPTKEWTPAEDSDEFFLNRRVAVRTRKEPVPLVKYMATKEHPAQVDVVNKDVKVGIVEHVEMSGAITFGEKEKMLKRGRELLNAIRSARSRANDVEAADEKVGSKLYLHILGDSFYSLKETV